MNLCGIVMVQWNWLLIMLMVFFDDLGNVSGTAWDGITPWYTGSRLRSLKVLFDKVKKNKEIYVLIEHYRPGDDDRFQATIFSSVPRGVVKDTPELECNCNGFSNRCFFDQKLYDQTGHGGHCLDCSANRDGPNCERCRDNYHMREDGYCIPCDCNPVGSRNLQCDANGKCQCQPGVIGDKCDRCVEGFYDFSASGCRTCGCSDLGTVNNQKNCHQDTGDCFCKENVEGRHCTECKPGFFNLDSNNPFGCTPCFCYGHSSECSSAFGYSKYLIESPFVRSSERWSAEDDFGLQSEVKYEHISQSIGVKAKIDEIVYFVAPPIFLGDQRASYNQLLEFTLRIGDNRATPTSTDIILEGAASTVACTIFAQDNRVPTIQPQRYAFRLHEHPEYGWQPRLSSRAFISILSNLTSIKIRGTYYPQGVGFLDDVKLHTAIRGRLADSAMWIETCECPTGYVGQFCESCAPGYRHFPPTGGSFAPCIPCECNNHADICDSETGRCICEHNTAGENCQLCARGYYGNAFGGTSEDCQPCNCPNGGACIQIDDDVVMCTECPQGYAGHRCEICSDGYYGDPLGEYGPQTPCLPCKCNNNIDLNAIGNCDTTTGECLKCIYNTAGRYCDVCVPGYYGNALVLPKGDCKPCQCHPDGSVRDITGAAICDQATGACQCQPYVTGRNCEQCEHGYYNIQSGNGCEPCNCDRIGSLNQTCDVRTGRCYCRQGVTGLRCDHCEYKKFGFSYEGCRDCDCDPIGSSELQCDATGQCPCLENVEGRKCDKCKENKYDRQRGCVDCPDCYKLVQEAAKTHNDNLDRFREILDEIERRPIVISDDDFPKNLKRIQLDINRLNEDVHDLVGDNGSIDQVRKIEETGKDVSRKLSEVEEELFLVEENIAVVERNLDQIEELSDEVTEKVEEIKDILEYDAKEALDRAVTRAKIAGEHSDQMTKLAQEARDLVDDIETKANDIVMKAEDVKNKSINAYTEVKEANFKQAEFVEAIRNFKEDLATTEKKMNDTINWTKEVSNRASMVKNNATALLNDINNIQIPELNVNDLSENSSNLRKEALEIKEQSDELIKQTSDLRKTLDKQNDDRKKLLKDAKDQQEDMIELRNDLIFALEQANAASKLWEEIYKGAVSNYNLLKDFDTETQKSKDEAEEALKSVDEIEEIIKQSLEETKNAQKDVDEAAKTVNLALLKAQQAKDLAVDMSAEAEQAKVEAQLLIKNSTNLRNEAGLMYDRVQNTDGELKSLLEKHKSNESLVNEAREKVGRAGRDTDDVSRKVQNLLSEIDDIMSELENSPTLDEKDIDRLEEQIKITEEKLKETRLLEKLEQIQKDHKQRNELIEQYKLEIAWLQNEVDNIEEVLKALPEGCFRRLELEP